MSTNDWESANSEYLALSLQWLRLCLRRRAASPDGPANAAGAPGLERDMAALELRLEEIAAAMATPPALLWLASRLGLNRFERQLLLLCASVEFDTGMGALCAAAAGSMGQQQPTFALALSVFEHPVWEALSPARPLRYWRLIEVATAAAQTLTASPLRIDERVVNFLKGLNHLDERLAALFAPLEPGDDSLPLAASQESTAEAIERLWTSTAGYMAPPIVQLLGSDSLSKQLIAARACAAFNWQTMRINCDLLPQQPGDIEALARLWRRECMLSPLALYCDLDVGESAAAESHMPAVRQFLSKVDGSILVGARHALSRPGRDHVVFDVSKPTAEEQSAEWGKALPQLDPAIAGQLSGQFNLNQAEIRRIALEFNAATTITADADAGDFLWNACRLSVRPRLDQLAQRLDAKATWDDLVLPAEETGTLRQITAQVMQRGKVYGGWGFGQAMNRGLGISALFAGDSGTGKTMAAEVIANELKLNLYRIDLSAVVSKYIGETEKNLCRLFDGAEDGGVILFFDEADALFGKRSEVKDSHDRFANIEINYLLQRIESYRGVAILATNMKGALDSAFLRRLRFSVRFPFPSKADRSRIWQRAFPAQAPLQDVDFEHLARFNMTGGAIHGAALNAAFLAAAANSHITMKILMSAVRSEFLKLERPINESDFRWLESAMGAA
ncbi:MAG TPA: ATP-binding protein [Steroidobacteraceae bacterium]|nr:ATP-binding protein [Steroidobacteraceae bacterium]